MNKWIGIAVAVVVVIGGFLIFSGGGSDATDDAQPAETSSETESGGTN